MSQFEEVNADSLKNARCNEAIEFPIPPTAPFPLTRRRPSSPKATRFTAIMPAFEDDYRSKLGDWTCGYTSLLLSLGYVVPERVECSPSIPAAAGAALFTTGTTESTTASSAAASAVDPSAAEKKEPTTKLSNETQSLHPTLKVNDSRNASMRHLDVGCGKGALCAVLQKRFNVGRVVGVDVVEAAIDACHLRYAPSLASASDTSEDTSNACASADVPSPPPSPSLEFRVVNRSDKALPFPPGSFEAVSSCFMLSGLPSHAAQLSFVKRCGAVLVPGGMLCLLVNNPEAYGQRFTSIQLEGPPPSPSCSSSNHKSGQSTESSSNNGTYSGNESASESHAHPVEMSAKSLDANGGGEGFERGEKEAWGPGRVCKATFFDDAGNKTFACNDRWWPRAHYEALLTAAGFEDVKSSATPFGGNCKPRSRDNSRSSDGSSSSGGSSGGGDGDDDSDSGASSSSTGSNGSGGSGGSSDSAQQLAQAAALLGLPDCAVPEDAPERRYSPVLCVTGRWPGGDSP